MTVAYPITSVYPVITDIDGQPLEGGYVWIGQPDLDPQTNPIQVYWDKELTIAAPQPIRTIGGYFARSGSPANVYAATDFSMRVMNKNGSIIYSAPKGSIAALEELAMTQLRADLASSAAGRGADLVADAAKSSDLASTASGKGSELIGFMQSGDGAVGRTAMEKMRESVSVLDFGADPTGTTSSSAAFEQALSTGKRVHAPAGTYRVTLDLLTGDVLFGDGPRRTYLIPETGATYVLRLDARTVIKQYVTIRDLGITNPNSVPNCYGLYLQGTNVSSTNDFHLFQNIYIGQSVVGGSGFLKGFYCTGRMIWSRLIGVDVCFNTGKGWHFATDTTTPAFNSNQFISCTGLSNVQEGFLSTGQSAYNQMFGCVFETNNTSGVAGTADIQVHDADSWVVDGLGLEGGGSVAINTTNPLSNGIGLRLTGNYSRNMTLRGLYGSASGCIVAVDAALIQGGSLSGSQLLPGPNGFAFAGISAAGNAEAQQQFVFDCNNTLTGTAQVKFTQDVNGNYAFCVQQSKGAHYITSAPTLNLLRMSSLVANPTGGNITINTINNRLPGCTLEVSNIHGSNTVTIAATLMNSGTNSVIAANSSKRYLVIGYPNEGKLVEM